MALTTMVKWPSSEQGTRCFTPPRTQGADNSSSCDVFTLACEIGEGKSIQLAICSRSPALEIGPVPVKSPFPRYVRVMSSAMMK